MKKIIFGVVLLALFAAMGCGNSTIRSAEIYLQQNDQNNARRVINDNMPTLPEGEVKAQAYRLLAGITHDELVFLNSLAKRESSDKSKPADPKRVKELYVQRLAKISQMNEEINNSLKSAPTYKGKLDTFKIELWNELFNNGVGPYNDSLWSEAIVNFKLAWAIDSSRVEPSCPAQLIGEALLQEEHGDDAVGWFERAIKMEKPTKPNYMARISIANYYYNSTSYEKAIEYYNKVLASPLPTDSLAAAKFNRVRVSAIASKAICFDQLKRKPEALKAYEDALKEQPDNTTLWFNLGQRHIDGEKWADAQKAFEKVLSLDPKDLDAKYLLGIVLFQQNKYVEAETVFQAYVEVKPTKQEAWTNLRAAIGNQISILAEKKNPSKADQEQLKVLQKKLLDINEKLKKLGFQ